MAGEAQRDRLAVPGWWPCLTVVRGRPVDHGHAGERHHLHLHDRAVATWTACASCSSISGCRSPWSILAFTAVPLFHRAKVYTAYEYLERRFDARTRALVSAIFLTQRGLALGITLYAPAVVLTVILGWPDWLTTLVMGGIAVTYTTTGGVKAIAWTDFQQMVVMTLGLIAALLLRDLAPAGPCDVLERRSTWPAPPAG